MKFETGDSIKAVRGGWDFKNIKTEDFETHVSKSVPNYFEGHEYIRFLSDYFIHDKSRIYDIGCSTGNLISKLSCYHKDKKELTFIGIEPSLNFKKEFILNTSDLNDQHIIEFVNSDIQELDLEPNDMVIAYYTIQFIPPRYRQEIINKIYNNLNWGGGFFFFEKVRGDDARFQDMLNLAYLEYKKLNGYNNNEIMNKMLSLKGRLEPYTSKENNLFLKRAGFNDICTISKNLCFEGKLAIK